MRTRRHLVVAAVTGLATVALVGCTAGTTVGPPATGAATSSTSAATTPASAPASAASSSPPSGTAPATSPAPSAAPSAGASGTPPCTSGALSASLGPGAGGAAGHTYVDLVLTSTAARTCTLQGWPGVSLVGDGNGTQLGAAADRDATIPRATVTLAPGASAHARLAIANALNYRPSTCNPVTADGLRVYPPGETHALFIPTTKFTACRNAGVNLLAVSAVASSAA